MNRYGTSALLKFNIKNHLDRLFVNNGLYFNVASGSVDVQSRREDVLRRIDGRTYESLFDRWVYESDASGVKNYTTTVCSGVTINGVFNVKNSAPYYPAIDYNNGRVVCSGLIPSTATVSTTYSYKQVITDFPGSNVVNALFSQSRDNVDLSTYAYPSGNQRQVPCLIIDLQAQRSKPFALGGYKQVTQTVVFHILANNENDIDTIIDVLSGQFRNVIKGVDFNKTPVQFTYQGDLAATYKNFTQLQADSSYAWSNIYIDKVTIRSRDVFYDMRRARIDWDVIIIKGQS